MLLCCVHLNISHIHSNHGHFKLKIFQGILLPFSSILHLTWLSNYLKSTFRKAPSWRRKKIKLNSCRNSKQGKFRVQQLNTRERSLSLSDWISWEASKPWRMSSSSILLHLFLAHYIISQVDISERFYTRTRISDNFENSRLCIFRSKRRESDRMAQVMK